MCFAQKWGGWSLPSLPASAGPDPVFFILNHTIDEQWSLKSFQKSGYSALLDWYSSVLYRWVVKSNFLVVISFPDAGWPPIPEKLENTWIYWKKILVLDYTGSFEKNAHFSSIYLKMINLNTWKYLNSIFQSNLLFPGLSRAVLKYEFSKIF